MLFNMSAFMVMMKVPKPDVKKKVRRLLGRSHVGLIHSQCVNDVLDQINNLVSWIPQLLLMYKYLKASPKNGKGFTWMYESRICENAKSEL